MKGMAPSYQIRGGGTNADLDFVHVDQIISTLLLGRQPIYDHSVIRHIILAQTDIVGGNRKRQGVSGLS